MSEEPLMLHADGEGVFIILTNGQRAYQHPTNPDWFVPSGPRRPIFKKRRQWLAIKERYGGRCVDCGRSEAEVPLERDHVIPVSRGGRNTADNIVPRCRTCNRRKSNRLLGEQVER